MEKILVVVLKYIGLGTGVDVRVEYDEKESK